MASTCKECGKDFETPEMYHDHGCGSSLTAPKIPIFVSSISSKDVEEATQHYNLTEYHTIGELIGNLKASEL
jgi:hypothetical protein